MGQDVAGAVNEAWEVFGELLYFRCYLGGDFVGSCAFGFIDFCTFGVGCFCRRMVSVSRDF